ncbi:MAG: type IV toxin-antitoxin system AbiEi family antitoxin [Chloroflexota bacterium]
MTERKSVEGRGSDLLVFFAQRNPPTFDAREAAELLAVDTSTLARILSTLAARGWITRHRKGIYEIAPLWATPSQPFDPDRYAALARWVREPYYVGFRSALEIRDWLDHPVRGRIWIAVSTPHHAPTTMRDRVTWVVLREDRFSWGRERHWIGDQAIWISDPERTVLDGLHLPRHVGGVTEVVSVLVRAWSSFDRARLQEHADRFAIEAVRRRLGFVLEAVDLPGAPELAEQLHATLSHSRRSPVVLDPSLPIDGPVDRRWGVRVNLDRAQIAGAGRT